MTPSRTYIPSSLLPLLLASCSITEHLPQGEVLYTGVDHIEHHTCDTVDDAVRQAVATALEVQPNSALLGSAYHMSPIPVGLWIYNGLYTEQETGFRHWLWSHFKSDPTLVSQVNPRLRAQAAEAALKDEGYFDATVTYDTVYSASDSLRAKLSYGVTYQHQSRLGSVTYVAGLDARIDSIVHHTLGQTVLHPGDRFSSSSLEAEQQRIATTLQDSGYYYFTPECVKYIADSTQQANTVNLRVLIGAGADRQAMLPCVIDSVHYKLDYGAGLRSQNADTLRFVTIGYNGPLQVTPRTLRRALGFRHGALLTPDRLSLAQTLLSRLDIFKYSTYEFEPLTALQPLPSASLFAAPADTLHLRMNVHATYNYPWHGTTEIGATYKDDGQVGPGATFTAARRNLFGGGERLSFQLKGSYEWSTGYEANGDGQLNNSYELGAKVALSVPRLQLPRMFRPSHENPVSSTYSASIDWMRRAGHFEMLKASSAIDYTFSINRCHTFTFTPLKLTYVSLLDQTSSFDSIMSRNPALEHSFEDQFIPQLQLSWTYDSSPVSKVRGKTTHYFNLSLAEAGGLVDLFTGWFGTHRNQGERQLFYQPFSQFVKGSADYRFNKPLGNGFSLAGRLYAGIGYAYGNSTELPYSEKFYIGGANSLRGFSVRGVGPGSNKYVERVSEFNDIIIAWADKNLSGTERTEFLANNSLSSYTDYAYLNRVGDIKLETNFEFRFPIAGSLYGALFTDVGNVWRLHGTSDLLADTNHYLDDIIADIDGTDEARALISAWLHSLAWEYYDSQQLRIPVIQQLAWDCGLGFRLDMGMLVLRFDIGVPLHNPNLDTDHYFNCRHAFFRNLGYNLAVGYPF